MPVNFRCDSCGKLLSFDGVAEQEMQCPHCQATVVLPEALASMPQPHVAPNAAPPPADFVEEDHEDDSKVAGAFTHLMPGVISIFLHVGLAVIFYLAASLLATDVIGQNPNNSVVYGPSFNLDAGGVYKKSEHKSDDPTKQAKKKEQWEKKKEEAIADAGATDSKAAIVSSADMNEDIVPEDDTDGASGPEVDFVGQGGNAHHVVFVIDGSGSMGGMKFAKVKDEIGMAVSKLDSAQTFHIIFFHSGVKDEFSPKCLVSASEANKRKTAKFLHYMLANNTGGTGDGSNNTNPMAALERAFAVLRDADKSKKGKMIFLLTDGEFSGEPDKVKLIRDIKRMNKKNDVAIFTFLYGGADDPTNPESVGSVLRKIADDKNERFEHIVLD